MKKLMALPIIFLFTFCTSPDALFHKAIELEQRGAYAEAIMVLDQLIESDSTYLSAYVNRGADKSELGRWSEAIEDYSHVIDRDSTYIVAWVYRGNDKVQLGDYSGALADLETAARIRTQIYGPVQVNLYNVSPDSKDVAFEELYLSRGIAYWYVDSITQAYSDINYCIDQNYEMVASLYWRAYIYWKAGKVKEASLDFLSVIRLGEEEEEYVLSAKKNLEILGEYKSEK